VRFVIGERRLSSAAELGLEMLAERCIKRTDDGMPGSSVPPMVPPNEKVLAASSEGGRAAAAAAEDEWAVPRPAAAAADKDVGRVDSGPP